MAEPTYLDRLYNEIGQLGERVRSNLTNPSMILRNAATPYQSMEEQARLQAQQSKEDYMAMQEGDQPAPAAPAPAIPGLDERSQYLQYLKDNEHLLQYADYATPTQEQYKRYFIEGEAPEKVVANMPKAIAVTPAVAEMVTAAPRQAPAARQPQQAQPQRRQPQTIGEMIAALPFEGDRYEAKRKVIEGARLNEINRLNAYVDQYFPGGRSSVEGDRFLRSTLAQIDANYQVPKPIEETEDFKVAREAIVSGKHADRLFMLAEIKGLLETAKTIKNKNEKVAILELNLPKLVQSIAAGADAIQPSEQQRIMSELTSILQSPGESLELLGRRGLGAFKRDPDAFIEKVSKIYNSVIPAVNQRSYGYQNNLGQAFTKLGVGYLGQINEKNQGIDMTKLQQLREGRSVQSPPFQSTYPAADRPAPTSPQIIGKGSSISTGYIYGGQPSYGQKQGEGF
jgi:hypothetical protein